MLNLFLLKIIIILIIIIFISYYFKCLKHKEHFSNNDIQLLAVETLELLQNDFRNFFKTTKKLSPKTIYKLNYIKKNRKFLVLNKKISEFMKLLNNQNTKYVNYFINKFDPQNYKYPNDIFDESILEQDNTSEYDNDEICNPPIPAPTPCPSGQECPKESTSEHFANVDLYLKTNKNLKNNRKNLKKFLKKYEKHNKYNKFLDQNIENFDNVVVNENTLHKHSSIGQIEFKNDFEFNDKEWLKDPKNLKLIEDYNFLPDKIKDNILKNTINIENELNRGNEYLKNLFKKYDKMISVDDNKLFVDLRKKIKSHGYDDVEKKYIEELEKDKSQDKKLKEINEKIKTLEDQQNNINLSEYDNINSIKSFNDGQTLSIINNKDNEYKIKINDGCLGFSNNNVKLENCASNKKDLLFELNQVKNTDELNNYIKNNKISNNESIYYPFHLLNPKLDKNKCISMDNLKVNVVDCNNKENVKWRGLKTIKRCSKYN